MKKAVSILIILAIAGLLSGCEKSGTSVRPINQSTGVIDVIQSRKAAEDEKKAMTETTTKITSETTTETTTETVPETTEESSTTGRQNGVNEGASEPSKTAATKASKSKNGIDVDLTSKSANMVYTEVYNMMVTPEKYIGKTVKMKGTFAQYHDEAADKYYFACIIKDAMACCSQGMEFVLNKKYKFPKDYPKEGDKICVIGVFQTYKEGKDTYCTLTNARIVK